MTNENLWSAIYGALEWGMPKKDLSAQYRLNRLAREYFSDLDAWLGEDTCKARYDNLPITSLNRCHRRANPQMIDGPIIVLSYQGKLVVIDGNNRVNAQYLLNAQKIMPAIVIEFL